VVAYQLMSGRLPYEANSLSELALKQQRESPPPLDQLNPRVPRELARAVAIALAIDQNARPADAMLLADAFRNGLHGIDPMPGDLPTEHLGTAATAATRMLPRDRHPTAPTRPATSPATEAMPWRTASPSEASRVSRREAAGAYGRGSGTDRAAGARTDRAAGARSDRAAGARTDRAAAPRRSRRSGRRFLALLVVIALFVGVVAAAIAISAGTSRSVVHFRKVVAHDAQSAINQVQNLVNQYTK
jgi:serine/threonine-protein kinase